MIVLFFVLYLFGFRLLCPVNSNSQEKEMPAISKIAPRSLRPDTQAPELTLRQNKKSANSRLSPHAIHFQTNRQPPVSFSSTPERPYGITHISDRGEMVGGNGGVPQHTSWGGGGGRKKNQEKEGKRPEREINETSPKWGWGAV